jgi:hypothetical protein
MTPSRVPLIEPRQRIRGWMVGPFTLLCCCILSVGVGGAAASWTDGRVSISLVMAALGLVVLAINRHASRVLERVIAPIFIGAMAVPIAVAVYVDAAWTVRRISQLVSPFAELGNLLVVLALVVLISWTAPRLARRMIAAGRRVLLVLAWLAVGGTAALLVVAHGRCERPSPNGYISGMRNVGVLPARDADLPSGTSVRQRAGDFHALRQRSPGRCRLWLARGEDPSENSPALSHQECSTLIVRVDDARQVLVLEDELEMPTGEKQRIAYDAERPWVVIDLLRRLHGELRPYDTYTALALLGVIVALVSLLRPRIQEAPLDGDCRDAVARGDRTLALDDGTPPLPIPDGMDARPGPVIAVLRAPAGAFREQVQVIRLVPGTLGEQRLAPLALPAFALAFVAVAATPLAVALVVLG